jgi:uncharacterized protein (DUF362 family)
MKEDGQTHQLSRRRFIGQIAADTAALGIAGTLQPFKALAQAVSSSAPAGPDASQIWTPSDPPNQPIGAAQGIFPGRVAWVRDPAVARWDGKTGRWWDEGNIDERALAQMWSRSLRAVSGAHNDRSAWDKVFRHFNQTHGRGRAGWTPGESIAIKINLNNAYGGYADADNEIDTSTQSIRALLHQLTKEARVAQKDIVVYDSSPGGGKNRRSIPDRIYVPLHAEFPEVRWVDCQGLNGRQAPEWVSNAITYTSPKTRLGNDLPRCVVDATYLINLALLKGHEIAGITLTAKNHYGSIQFPSRDHGYYLHAASRPLGDYSGLVDLMGSPNLGGKTMLYILDGVYGTRTNVGKVGNKDRWNNLFNGEWSAMYLMSLDPVAIDSVGLDFLHSEFGYSLGFSGNTAFPLGSVVNSDNFLHEAAAGTNKEFGPYKPNGKLVGSLGVHEHWNNSRDKQYSRNLHSKAEGIELFRA